MALSSVEAEYMTLAEATKETLHRLSKLKQYFQIQGPVCICCDNRGAKDIANNEVNNKRTKHIDVRYHMVRDYINKGNVHIHWIKTKQNKADILTKALTPNIHKQIVHLLL